MNILISYLCQVINSFFVAVFCCRALSCKYEKVPTILSFTIFSIITFGIKFCNFDHQFILMTAILLYEAGLYLFILAAFKSTVFERLLFGALLYMICIFIENILIMAFRILNIDTQNLNPDTEVYFIFSMIGFIGNLVAGFYITSLWEKIFRHSGIRMLLYFAVFPVVIIFLCQLMLLPFLIKIQAELTFAIILAAVLIPILCLLLFTVLLRRSDKKDIHDACEELQILSEMEQKRYCDLETKRDELAKLRHDYNNQLSAIQILISSQKYTEAYKLAHAVKKVWEDTNKGCP